MIDFEAMSNPVLLSQKVESSDYMQMIQDNGKKHELECWDELRKKYESVSELGYDLSTPERIEATQQAIEKGVDIIFQGALQVEQFIARPDFIVRVDAPSKLGSYSYEVKDAKLSRSAKADAVLQLMHYSEAISHIQGFLPQRAFLILGDKLEKKFDVKNYFFYFSNLKKRFLNFFAKSHDRTVLPLPLPCTHCEMCHWRNYCNDSWLEADHLVQVAGINKDQIIRFNQAGIQTMEGLANLSREAKVKDIGRATFLRLQQQAKLQVRSRAEGSKPLYELIMADEAGVRSQSDYLPDDHGLGKLPNPEAGDLFFDIEGDPLLDEKLEYLFGIFYLENKEEQYRSFWALSLAEEKKAFMALMEFIEEHFRKFPKARIYHYASYEKDALRRLSNKYGVSQAYVDNLLRNKKLIDLYQIVRDSIRISEPRYSIKNLEKFYLEDVGKRTDSVTNGSDSVIFFEMWRESGGDQNSRFLQDIERYNLQDVRSTYFLRRWLIQIAKANDILLGVVEDDNKNVASEISERAKRYAKELAIVTHKLNKEIQQSENGDPLRSTLIDLLDFYKRDEKPQWWSYFDRKELPSEDRVEREDCIATVQLNEERDEKKSVRYYCNYVKQKTSIKTNDKCLDLFSGKTLNNIVVNHELQTVNFKASRGLRFPLDIGLAGPVSSTVLSDSIFRYGGDIERYPAISQLLHRDPPQLKGLEKGTSLLKFKSLDQFNNLVSMLDHSLVFVQGPPGTGKTFLTSKVIVDLISQGYKIGVTSNSHKAILNMLLKIVNRAEDENVVFRGAKKSSKDDTSQHFSSTLEKNLYISDVFKVDELIDGDFDLLAGTAWFFANERLNQKIDYLIIEEAGQMSLATAIAAGTCAKNLILVGDQNQLEQPIQGIHPNDSGMSVINYYLKKDENSEEIHAVVPEDKGVFLDRTHRLHPKICDFVSEAFYGSKLLPVRQNIQRELIWEKTPESNITGAGIRLLLTAHEGCSKVSKTEANEVKQVFNSLLQHASLKVGDSIRRVQAKDILVIAPYNMQVELLKTCLPEGSKVGTIDKFQGQEAEVVIVSMTTSGPEEIGRDANFLFSKNRLNVALTRAKCLAIVLFSARLLTFPCRTPEQINLLNTFCWLQQRYATEDET